MKKLEKEMSMMGLILRKTMYWMMFAALVAFGLFWLLSPMAVSILGLLSALFILIFPFEWKERRAMNTLRRFAFDRQDFENVFGVTAFFEMHFMMLLLRFTYILRVGIEYGFESFQTSPHIATKLQKAEILFGKFPKIDGLRFIFINIIFFVVAIAVAKVVNRDVEK